MREHSVNGREPQREELLRAFGSAPPAFEAGIDRTLRRLTSEKEEPVVKKKLAFAPALVLALALLASVALAATLYPKTVELIRKDYGDDFANQLETYGVHADIAQSITLGDVRYTFTDAVWNAGVLYGTITMESAEDANALLICEGVEAGGPVGYNPLYGEQAPEGTKSYAETAKETGAKILLCKALPQGLIVDGACAGGEMGISEKVTPENAVVASFELYGVQQADSYPVRIDAMNTEVSPEGEALRAERSDTTRRQSWDVTVTPEAKEESAPTEPEAVNADGMTVTAPDAVMQGGAMPVYALTMRDFTSVAQPEWFNASGAAEGEETQENAFAFADGGKLTLSRETVFYERCEGTEVFHGYDGYSAETPAGDTASKLFLLASGVYADETYRGREPEEPLDAIPALTLEEAEEKLQALLGKLGVTGAQVVWSYGMDVERAQRLNAERDAAIEESGGVGYSDPYDLSGLTEEDGGFLLVARASVDGVCADDSVLDATAFVNKDGVARLSLRSEYAVGGEAAAPDKLIAPEEALRFAVAEARKSWLPELGDDLQHAPSVELVYAPKTAGALTLTPAWRITALDEYSDPFSVDIDAVDGALLKAPW